MPRAKVNSRPRQSDDTGLPGVRPAEVIGYASARLLYVLVERHKGAARWAVWRRVTGDRAGEFYPATGCHVLPGDDTFHRAADWRSALDAMAARGR